LVADHFQLSSRVCRSISDDRPAAFSRTADWSRLPGSFGPGARRRALGPSAALHPPPGRQQSANIPLNGVSRSYEETLGERFPDCLDGAQNNSGEGAGSRPAGPRRGQCTISNRALGPSQPAFARGGKTNLGGRNSPLGRPRRAIPKPRACGAARSRFSAGAPKKLGRRLLDPPAKKPRKACARFLKAP